jgi:hypothetical protein
MIMIHQTARLSPLYSSDLEKLLHTLNRSHRFEGDVSLRLVALEDPPPHTATGKELRRKKSVDDEQNTKLR